LEPQEPEWLTYGEAAERLNVSPHAVRARATRMGWRRQLGNDGRARILVALQPRAPDDQPLISHSSSARKAVDPAIVDTLKEHNGALEGHVATLKADVEKVEALLASERERTAQAIAAFQSLAERLEAIAEARRPWWRHLVHLMTQRHRQRPSS
jgi:hypothetical protein